MTILIPLTQQALKRVKADKSVDFSYEQLCFCYADIAGHNFMITNGNQLYIIDFGQAAFLPASFMSFVLNTSRGSSTGFVREISNRVQFPEFGNLEAMNRIAYCFAMSNSSKLG